MNMKKSKPELYRTLRWVLLGSILGLLLYGVYHFRLEGHVNDEELHPEPVSN